MGFKDDPTKSDKENLRLEAETVPVWMPGRSMRGSQVGWPDAFPPADSALANGRPSR